MRLERIQLDCLLLDPNNYRLQEHEGFVSYPAQRFHIERVQEMTRNRLKQENLDPLKNSIVSNGFLEIERIVVVPYEHEEGKYLVIEGNRRVAAIQQIREEYSAGIEFSPRVIEVLDSVPCLVVESEGQEAFFREAIMGIRHVGGIREWGGYQRAKLIADLRDNHDLEATSISDKIGLSVIEVNRRYRAYKALQQMQNDEEYGDYANPQLYPLFHEAVSLPTVREWLGWDADNNSFGDLEQREIFYQLISPRILEEGEQRPPKIKSYSDVRVLREIIPNAQARADLIQMERELVDAKTIANQDRISRRWKNEVNEAKIALSSIPALDVEQFEDDDVELIKSLIDVANRIMDVYRRSCN